MRIEAVLFDFDGTLTQPGAIDFAALRRAVGCPPGQAILEFLDTLPAAARAARLAVLDAGEQESARRAVPNDGAEDAVGELAAAGVRTGVLTRNRRVSVELALARFRRLTLAAFTVVITRDDPWPPKPAPAGVLAAAAQFGVAPPALLVVGDYRFDIEAGHAAGCPTVWLRQGPDLEFAAPPSHIIGSLRELPPLVRGARRPAAAVRARPAPRSGP